MCSCEVVLTDVLSGVTAMEKQLKRDILEVGITFASLCA